MANGIVIPKNLEHNDWLSGNKNKIVRAKELGHWFLRDNNTCYIKLVERRLNQLR
jgi:hypothetical protein